MQLLLDLQRPRCPGRFMCKGSYGFWTAKGVIFCMKCQDEREPLPSQLGGEGGTPPSEGAEAP